MKFSRLASTVTLVISIDLFCTLCAQANEGLKSPAVGSCYGGGVVFYVNPAPDASVGNRGLIVALTDANKSLPFAWDGSLKKHPHGPEAVETSSLYFAGITNTQTILNSFNDSYGWPAAQAAKNYNSENNATCPGDSCSDWYLPTKNELNRFYIETTESDFGSTCTGYIPPKKTNYWSSTAYGPTTAWHMNFHWGDMRIAYSNAEFLVRTVRSF